MLHKYTINILSPDVSRCWPRAVRLVANPFMTFRLTRGVGIPTVNFIAPETKKQIWHDFIIYFWTWGLFLTPLRGCLMQLVLRVTYGIHAAFWNWTILAGQLQFARNVSQLIKFLGMAKLNTCTENDTDVWASVTTVEWHTASTKWIWGGSNVFLLKVLLQHSRGRTENTTKSFEWGSNGLRTRLPPTSGWT